MVNCEIPLCFVSTYRYCFNLLFKHIQPQKKITYVFTDLEQPRRQRQFFHDSMDFKFLTGDEISSKSEFQMTQY